MNILKIVMGAMCATAIATACATTSSSSGSNSNWLEVCSTDSDCGGSLECWCGVCTKTCAAAAECSAFAPGATCGVDVEVTICVGARPSESACGLPCKIDDDCKVLDARSRCLAGACRRDSASSDAGRLTCNDRSTEVQSRYHDILTTADTAANETCSVDADCIPAPSVSCGDQCGLPFLSKAGAASLAPELATLERDLCQPYFATGCPAPVFLCPAIGFPTCVLGRCWNGQGTPSPDAGAVTCLDRTHQMLDRIEAAVARADDACRDDGDCTTVTLDNQCYHACESGAVSRAGAADVQAALASIEADGLCNAFEAAGCTSIIPPCTPPVAPKCIQNVCQFQ